MCISEQCEDIFEYALANFTTWLLFLPESISYEFFDHWCWIIN